jgi:hypothetical protein
VGVLALVLSFAPRLVRCNRWSSSSSCCTATALPLLVALAEIGLRNGTMLRENAAALVGAGALSVLVFPMLAVAIERRRRARERPEASALE